MTATFEVDVKALWAGIASAAERSQWSEVAAAYVEYLEQRVAILEQKETPLAATHEHTKEALWAGALNAAGQDVPVRSQGEHKLFNAAQDMVRIIDAYNCLEVSIRDVMIYKRDLECALEGYGNSNG